MGKEIINNIEKKKMAVFFNESYELWSIIAAGDFSDNIQSKTTTTTTTTTDDNKQPNSSNLPIVVYSSCMRREDRMHVAIKAIKLSLIDDEDVRERCLLEAAVISEINRPNIVSLFNYFEEDGALYIEMELFKRNSNLAFIIKEQNGVLFTEKQIGAWFAQISAALAHMHKKSLLHRNLQTKNVFITMNGKLAKLGGYIIPRPLDRTILHTDPPDAVRHLPPELSESVNEKTDRIYEKPADIWSLGILLYEMTTLIPPFEAGNQLQLFRKMAGSNPPEIPETFSSDLRRLVDRLLDKTPSKRPSMQQVLMDRFVRLHLPFIFREMFPDDD